jgi:isochorismate hydrolase
MNALTVDPYDMPGISDIPVNKAAWRLDPGRALLLIHDMQNYFVAPFGRTPVLRALLLSNIAQVRDSSAAAGIPVVFSAQLGGMSSHERGLLADFWGAGMTAAARDRDIVAEVRPRADDIILTKWRYSAFHRSGLLEVIRQAGRDQLIVCGVYAYVGVLMTACDALAHDIQTFLVGDAVADFSRADHVLALTYAAQRCASIEWTAELLGRVMPLGARRT